jgi:hypothetical protein
MPLETRNRDGRLDVVHRREASLPLRRLGALLGLSFCLLPLLALLRAEPSEVLGLTLGQILLLSAALKLLAESSRRTIVRASLHLGTGEVEIRRGRGFLSVTRAYGPVEVDRVVLASTGTPDDPRYDVFFVTRGGRPVRVVVREKDEPAALDAALVLSQGLSVPLEDRRFPDPAVSRSGSVPPGAVARIEDGPRRIFVWDERDRFRPIWSLLCLGTASGLAVAFPAIAGRIGLLALAPAALMLGLAFWLAAHLLGTLTVRRMTLRPDAVRFERLLAGVPLLTRLTLYGELKAVLILGRGPFATVSLRTSGPGTGASFPLEDPLIAGWLRNTIQRAAHDAGRRKTHLAG